MITTLWVLPHIIVFINRNNNTIINLCCFLMLLIILFIKPVTYDLPWYFAYYEIVHKNLHEYGFEVIITILNFIFRDGKLVHYGLTILSLVFISLSVRNHLNISGQKKLLLIGIITLGSIFFMVGTQNNVRQFVAISVLLISLLNLNSTNLNKLSKLGYFSLIIFSIFIHWSNIFVVLLFFLSYLIKNIKDNTIEVNHLLLNSFSKVIFFILGIVLLFVLSSLYQGSDYVYTSERLD